MRGKSIDEIDCRSGDAAPVSGSRLECQHLRQECPPHLGCASKARLDRMREPRRFASQEMRVQIDQLSVASCQCCDHVVDAAVIGTGDARLNAEEITRVIAERWVI